MKIEKYISALLVLLIRSEVCWVRAFGFRLSSCKRVFTTEVETQAVDGETWFINPDWTLANSKFKNLFVMVHEAKHLFSRHPERLRDCLPQQTELVHKAADYAVNLGLEQAGCPWQMPDDGLINRDFVDDDGKALNVERILALLMQENNEQEKGQDDDSGDNGSDNSESGDSSDSDDSSDDTASDQDTASSGAGDDSELGPDNAEPEVNQSENATGGLLPAPAELDANDNAQQNIRAATLAQSSGAGSIPDWLQSDIHKAAQNSATDWLSILRDRFASVIDHSDYSFRKINAAYALIGMIAPTLYNDGIGKVVIAGDESSSMSDEQLNHVTAQTAAILSEWMPQEVIIVRHTSDIVFTEYLSQGEEPTKRKKRAHGGTDFMPVIDLAEREQADCLIWVTDCMPMDRPRQTEVPTIWLGAGYSSERSWQHYLNYGDYIKVD